ncbi:hypothetical protein KC361_g8116 [Hortaea werneckii]|nr:hypothetical protein KC361_g8116 [Hortaea werneckii]
MSPTSSATFVSPFQTMAPPPRPSHSRHTSVASGKQQLPPQQHLSQTATKAPSPRPKAEANRSNVHYTCFIRLPFQRNGFEDPAPVEWDVLKDRSLWKLISKASNPSELDWDAIAGRFGVSKGFLFQQAAWLYERHFEGMRKVMKMGAGGTGSSAPSPIPLDGEGLTGTPAPGEEVEAGGLTMARQGSRDSHAPSTINTLKAVPAPSMEGGSPGTGTPLAGQSGISRTPSTTTVTQSKQLAGSGDKQPFQRAFRTSSSSGRRPAPPTRPSEAKQKDDRHALDHDESSDSTSEDEPSSRSQAFRRPTMGKKPALRTLSSDGDGEEDEDSSNGYLPFAATSSSKKDGKDEMTATLKDPLPRRQQNHHHNRPQTGQPVGEKGRGKAHEPPPTSSEEEHSSSATSSVAAQPRPSNVRSTQDRPPGPISPSRRAQLASLSPQSRRDGGSEASPSEGGRSMGSSFSDLEGDSVTQSALESALAEHIREHGSLTQGVGSIASRVGSLAGRGLGSGFGKRQGGS